MKVYEFTSSKDFIKKSFELSKKNNSAITVERYAKTLGFGASTLKMILSDKRQPTIHQVLCVARGLRLSTEDTAYLETLVLREMAKTTWQKAHYTKILTDKKKNVKLSTVHLSERQLLSDPIILPLLVYFLENKTKEISYEKLAKDLRVTESRILELVELFKKNEILMSQPNGQFHVAFDKLSHRLAQKKYQKEVLKQASERIDQEYDNTTSFFVSYAFSTTEKSLLQLQQDLKNLMAKYMSEEGIDPKDKQVAQACFQVFPVIR